MHKFNEERLREHYRQVIRDPYTHPSCASVFQGRLNETSSFYWTQKTWGKLLKGHRIVEDKSDVGSFVPGILDKKRSDENIISRSAIALDFDSLNWLELIRLLNVLKEFSFIAYTTYSHLENPEIHRIRVLLIPSKIMIPAEARPVTELVLKWVESKADVVVDRCSLALSQAFYLPACPKSRAHLAWIRFNPGRPVFVGNYLAKGRAPEVKSHKPFMASKPYSSERFNKVLNKCLVARTLFNKVFSGEQLTHLQRTKLAQFVVGLGIPLSEGISFFSGQTNFNQKITERALRGFKYPPSCVSLSRDLKQCDGNCTERQKLGRYSPVFFADLKEEIV